MGCDGPLQQGGEPNPFLDGGIQRLGLSETEIDDLVELMNAFTSDGYASQGRMEMQRQRTFQRGPRQTRDTDAAMGRKGNFGDAIPDPDKKDPALIGGRPVSQSGDSHGYQTQECRNQVVRTEGPPDAGYPSPGSPRLLQGDGRRRDRRRRQGPATAPLLPARGGSRPTAKPEKFSFAYVSDTHLYSPKLNDQFVRAAIRAVDDVNRLDPQPDFVLFGGDLAQLGAKEELDIGRQILKDLKAPIRMMVGEHDWFLDLGQSWQDYFGKPTYSFDHKGVHFVTLMSVNEKDFWTARGMTPEERMHTVAGLDNGTQSRFEVGAEQRQWLSERLGKRAEEHAHHCVLPLAALQIL